MSHSVDNTVCVLLITIYSETMYKFTLNLLMSLLLWPMWVNRLIHLYVFLEFTKSSKEENHFEAMKMAKLLFLAVCYSFLIIFAMAATTESRLVFRRNKSFEQTTTTTQKPFKSNIFTVPRVDCEPGYALVADRCRKVIKYSDYDSWF